MLELSESSVPIASTCVYLHTRKTDGFVFYVGIGTVRRAHDLTKSRNQHWKATAAKHGCAVTLVHTGLTFSEACLKEVELIAHYRALVGACLVNKTDGGEGSVGCVRSEETRQRIRLAATNISEETRQKMRDSYKNASDEVKARRIAAAKIKKPTSMEAKAKMSATRKGRPMPLETRLKISETQKNLPQHIKDKMSAARILAGTKHSEETRRKIGDANRNPSVETRTKLSQAAVLREINKREAKRKKELTQTTYLYERANDEN